jgi:hypothetical protein
MFTSVDYRKAVQTVRTDDAMAEHGRRPFVGPVPRLIKDRGRDVGWMEARLPPEIWFGTQMTRIARKIN